MFATRVFVVALTVLLLPLGIVWGIAPVDKPKHGTPAVTTPARHWKIGVSVRKLVTGVEITDVVKDSPASLARLEPRDVIVTVNGQQVGIVVNREVDLLDALAHFVDDTGRVVLLVRNHRDGSLVNVPIRAVYDGPEPRRVVTRKPVIELPPQEAHPGLKSVVGYYQKYLGRQARPEELYKWQNHLVNDGHLQDVQVDILSCDEYYARCGGSFRPFVNDLYKTVLGRAPNAREAQRWEQRMLTQLRGSRKQMVKLFFVLEVNNGRAYP